MASVTIRRNIILKAVVTDKLREEVMEELQEAAQEVAQRIEELDTAGRRYITDLKGIDLQRAMALRQQVEQEKGRQKEVRERLLARREEVSRWKNGTEVVRGTIEGYVEVSEGDNLAVVLGGTEMVVEDDIVREVRMLSPAEMSAREREVLAAAEDQSAQDVLGRIQTP